MKPSSMIKRGFRELAKYERLKLFLNINYASYFLKRWTSPKVAQYD